MDAADMVHVFCTRVNTRVSVPMAGLVSIVVSDWKWNVQMNLITITMEWSIVRIQNVVPILLVLSI